LKRTLFAVLFLLSLRGADAQQITRFAVIDLPKVIEIVKQNPRALREWEAHSARVQASVDRMTNEIKQLQDRRTNILVQGDLEEAEGLGAEIKTKEEALRAYYSTEYKKLEEEKSKLLTVSATSERELQERIMQEIENVAQEGGFSMVLDKKSRDIVWYSKTAGIDITEKVIERFRR